jgi:EB1-like C-terminal motif
LVPNALLPEDQQMLEDLKSERDFYFGKLRDLEVLCHEHEGSAFVQKVLDALYATEVNVHMSKLDTFMTFLMLPISYRV